MMSEQGWREFLAAEDVGDWAVLHGGATAVFPVLSLGVVDDSNAPGIGGSPTALATPMHLRMARRCHPLWSSDTGTDVSILLAQE
jgi:4a-hydroxytetrahydrobiopterin dehydratase